MNKYEPWLTDSGLTLLRGWAREGLTEGELAQRMGVTVATLRAWQSRFPELREALARSGQVLDYEVEEALLKKALGFASTERKVEVSPKGDRKETETVKQVAPDVSAISLWLKKRKPEVWGDGGGKGASVENNLYAALDVEGGWDDLPELQPEAAADPDLVAED